MATAYITHGDCLKHEMGAGHPECPDRLIAVNEHMKSSGLLDQLRVLGGKLLAFFEIFGEKVREPTVKALEEYLADPSPLTVLVIEAARRISS